MPDRTPHPLSRRGILAGGGILAASLAGCATRANAERGSEDARRDDELLAHLTDQRASIAPIAPAERAARRARLGTILAGLAADALVVEPGATLQHLAGISWGKSERLFALVVLADGAHFWLCPAFEESKARLAIDAAGGPGGAIVAWGEDEYPYRPLAAALQERRARRVLVEPQVRLVFADRIARELGRDRVALGDEAVFRLRARKDEHELALLRRASELTQLAIDAVSRTLTPGMTGAAIGARLDRAHERLGMRSPWNLSLLGAAAALPHGDPNAKPLEPGSILLVDTGASLHGYQSDTTRTWTFGARPSAEFERAWHCVRDAQRRAFDAIRPGVACRDVDAAARGVIERAGYGAGYAAFTHRLGHGIGMEGHEDPYFDGGSEARLDPGMTLSNEPGIYVAGRFGVRIEDIVAVTATGADHFGAWQSGPDAPR